MVESEREREFKICAAEKLSLVETLFKEVRFYALRHLNYLLERDYLDREYLYGVPELTEYLDTEYLNRILN